MINIPLDVHSNPWLCHVAKQSVLLPVTIAVDAVDRNRIETKQRALRRAVAANKLRFNRKAQRLKGRSCLRLEEEETGGDR